MNSLCVCVCVCVCAYILYVRDVIPYMLVKRAYTFQLEFENIFSQIKIHTLKRTINLKLKRLYIFCERGPT